MILKDISRCSEILDFNPRKGWPEALPPLSWQSFLIAGFGREGLAVDLSHQSFPTLFHACYPEMTMSEWAQFYRQLKLVELKDFSVEKQMEALFQIYGMKWSGHLRELCELLVETPRAFNRWAADKALSVNELSPLLSLKEKQKSFNPMLVSLAASAASRQQAAQLLELLVENFMLTEDMLLSREENESTDDWIMRLKKNRYPQTHARDTDRQTRIKALSWPQFLKVRYMREGDRSGVELRLFATHSADLKDKVERLRKLAERPELSQSLDQGEPI